MAKKYESVNYTNWKGTHVHKWVPIHHLVGTKVARKEDGRWKDILKIDERKLKHAESQLHKAVKGHFGQRQRG